ncbi:amino acid adenylation domain-containing protein [Actinokineospora sp. NPDC004072]
MTTVLDLIAEHARTRGDAPAVRQWDTTLTYAQLWSRACGLAASLDVRPEDRVGVAVERTPDLVVALLGVLLSGGAYVPIDPALPAARKQELLTDAGAVAVVSAVSDAVADLDPAVAESALAYVLYTSGSTGAPKGVLVTHASLRDYVVESGRLLGAGPETRALAASSVGFDASFVDLLVPLAAGGCVMLAGEADRADPRRLAEFVRAHGVDWGFLTPAVLGLVDPHEVPGWTTVLSGGDVVPAALARRWLRSGQRRFFNLYGPTETTVSVTAAEATGAESVLPIGAATGGHRLHVVDADLRPADEGELLVGGPGLARGYHGEPGLTAQRFIPDPFSGEPGARLYRTGDRVRLLPDGQVAYLGRLDRQVKIRGQRVEPAETEAALAGIEGVAECAVLVDGDALVAVVAPESAPDDLVERLAERLPPALVPARVVRVPALPLTPAGKVDRAVLAQTSTVDFDDPVEAAVARAWAAATGRPPTRDADFLAAGGHSLAAMRLVAALRSALGVGVAVEAVFEGRTVAGIAERVAKAEPLTGPAVPTGSEPALSPPQQRLWFMDQLAPDHAPYNIALATRLRGDLDVAALRRALTAVATRHDVLRWRILQTAGVPYAVRDEPAEVPLDVVHATADDIPRLLAADAAAPLDLAAGPAWRARLYRVAPDEHVLGITLHHAVFDGWSQEALYRDLADAYAGKDLPPLRAGYADYARWRAERDRRQGPDDLAWWTEHLAGAPTVLDLPRDRPRPPTPTYRGAEARARVERADAVRALAGRLATTPATVLVAAFGELLDRLTGGADHVVGLVLADRGHAEFDDVVGFFVDTVPMRLRGGGSFAERVARVADEVRAAAAHPAAALDRIVAALGAGRDPSHAPLVQVLVNVLDFADPAARLPGCAAEPVRVAKPGSPFDLTLYLDPAEVAVETVHNPDLFDAERIDALLADLAELAGALAADPDRPAAEVAAHLPRPAVRTAAPGAMARPAAEHAAAGGPETATERLVGEIWRAVLGRPVRASDNFFDIGGDSMAMAAVHARLTQATGRQVPLLDLFRHPNVRALARHLDGAGGQPELAKAAQRAAARRARPRPTRPAPRRGAQGD